MESKIIELKNGIVLQFSILKEGKNDLPAYEIYKDKEFQECFIHKATVDRLQDAMKDMEYNQFLDRLTEIAERTIRLAKGILEPTE